MRITKTKLLAFLIGVLIVISQGRAAYAEGEYPTWPQDFPKGVFRLSAQPASGSNWQGLLPTGLLGKVIEKGVLVSVKTCKSMKDPNCSDVNAWGASSLFDYCSNSDQLDCIEAINVTRNSGEPLAVKLSDQFPGFRPQDYVGDSDLHLPSGGSTKLITIEGAPHSEGNQYLLMVTTKSFLNDYFFSGFTTNSRRFDNTLFINLFAVKVKTGKFNFKPFSTNLQEYLDHFSRSGSGADGATILGSWIDEGNKCVLNTETMCATPVPIPTDLNFKVSVRTSFKPGAKTGSWFSGRVTNLSVKSSNRANGGYLFEVGGSPIVSPTVSGFVKFQEVPESLNEFYKTHPNQSYGGLIYLNSNSNMNYTEARSKLDPSSWSFDRRLSEYNSDSMEEFVRWLPLLGDKASNLPTLWSVVQIYSGRLGGGSMYGTQAQIQSQAEVNCLEAATTIAGFVATNATQFIDTWPTFNRAEGSLEYTVAAPHFEPDGKTVFKGTYDVAISEDVARCIYGFSAAPIKATVQVTSSTGQEQIATTTLRRENGILFMSANGFTFSSPTIKVRLYQDKAAESLPATKVEIVKVKKATKIISKSISCTRGSSTRKISGANPRCPKGYKLVK